MPTKTTRPTAPAGNLAAMNKKYGAVKLPEGFVAESSMGGVKWDYYEQPVLVGVVDGPGVRTIQTPDPDKKGATRDARVVSIVEDDTGAVYDVWESASLTSWFDNLTPGLEVAVVFQGMKPPKPGRSPMKMFVGGYKGGRPDAPAAPPKPSNPRGASRARK